MIIIALSENETAHSTVYHHLSLLSINIKLSGLIKLGDSAGLHLIEIFE